MATELPKAYDPKKVEDRIYRAWERSGFFNPDRLPRRRSALSLSKGLQRAFTIIMPPPNANGPLHIGHAVFVTLQDIMTRFWRMRGRRTLWLPGADHAGFETQVVFDKKLEKEGRSRSDVPRDQLYQEMLAFTLENKKIMEGQLRKLGASADWSREKFTLDSDIVKIVTDTFAKLYEDGLLYRGERIVNWCVKHQTTLSDLEVKYEERTDSLYYIRYGPLVLATVRPETKFGDTAVAVHPSDRRYRQYVGKEIEIETLIGSAKIKVIDDPAVDPKFGTGVIKVTPAHDPADFEIGKRHSLEVRPVIGKDGRLNEKTGPYAGLKVAEARKKVAEDMERRGLLVKTEPGYKHNVAVCYKCGTVVEPLIMPQWFIRMTEPPRSKKQEARSKLSLRDMAVGAVKSGKIKIVPKRYEKIFFHWMQNIRDWNISRQIVWGIRIPAWYCIGCGEVRMAPKIKGNWFFVRHGETDWNVERRIQGQTSPAGLNEKGRQQARAVAEQLAPYHIDLVISSDLPRARETAEVVSKKLGAELIFDSALRERNYGTIEGFTHDEVVERGFGEIYQKPQDHDFAPPGGESLRALEERVHVALQRHRDHHHHKNVVIVSHGSALKSLLRRLKNATLQEMADVAIHNASVVHYAIADACKKCGSDFVEQDPDVLDTWFSSGQWPYATLLASGRKKQVVRSKKQELPWTTEDFKTFYPTDVMETGYDILFFWVARMIMLGLYRTGKVPFRTVYLHGLVRDKDRQKMSKSKGNVIDPLGVAELYGTDAVRMALVIGNTAGNDIIISEEKIRGYRNFANKLWNIHRFIMLRSHSNRANPNLVRFNLTRLGESDRKRLTELKALTKRVTADLERFRFHHAADALYHYTWHTFADKIIESVKPRLESKNSSERLAAATLLLEIHTTLLKLLHPFMPYLTEELWQNLGGTPRLRSGQAKATKGLLMVEPWPH